MYLCTGVISSSAFAPGTNGFATRQSSFIDDSKNRYSRREIVSRYIQRQKSLCSTQSADNETIATLLQEIKELTDSFSNISSQANANAKLYNSKLEEYERQIDVLSTQLEEATTRVQEMTEEINEVNKKANSIELKTSNHIRDLEASNVELNEKLKTLSLDLQTEHDLVSSKDKVILSLEKKNNVLTTDCNRLEKELSLNADAIVKNRSENTNLLDQVKTYRQQTESYQRDISTMKEDHKGQISKLKNEYSLRKRDVEDISTMEQKMKELEMTISTMNQNESKMQSSIESSQKDKELSIDKITLLEEEISHLQQKLESATAQAAMQESSLQNKISQLEQKLVDNGSNEEMKLRKDLINVQAKSYDDLIQVQLEMNSSEEKASRELEEVMKDIELYEKERRSLRKLIGLGFKRAASLATFGLIWSK